jgi:PAS domain S-box-containing protein
MLAFGSQKIKPRDNEIVAAKISLMYAVLAGAWIFCADLLLDAFFSRATFDGLTQSIIAGVIVITTALPLFFLIRQTVRRAHASEAKQAALLERLELILDRMPIACMTIDRSFQFTYWNPAAEQIFGYSFDEVRGKTPFETITDSSRKSIAEEIFHRLKNSCDSIAIETENLTKDGRIINCSWVTNALCTYDNKFLGVISMVVDHSECLEAKKALQRSEESLRQAQAVAHLGNWELDLTTRKSRWSAEMFSIVGLPADAEPLNYETWMPIVHPEDREHVRQILERSMELGEPCNLDYRIRTIDNVEKYVNGQGQIIQNAQGIPVKFFGTVLDVTERKRAEKELQELNETLEQRVSLRTAEMNEATEDLRTFSYMISHNLRLPLGGLARFAQELASLPAVQVDASAAERVRRIIASATRLDRLIGDLFEYNRLLRNKIQPRRLSLILLLSELVGQFQREPEFAGVQITLQEPMPWVLAHRPTLSLVLQNFLLAAINSGGTNPLTIKTEKHSEKARIIISQGIEGVPFNGDNCSMPDEFALAIARRGIERMGGHANMQYVPGHGARFYIDLPLDPQSP